MKKENLKKQSIKKLEELKNNLSYDNEENYINMINIMINYDNNAQDKLYLYDSTQEVIEFVDDESLAKYIENQLKEYGVDRVKVILQNVESQNGIYKIDVYGNVYNVEMNDFIYCIDKAINKLKDSLQIKDKNFKEEF